MGRKRESFVIYVIFVIIFLILFLLGFGISNALEEVYNYSSENESVNVVFINSTDFELKEGKNLVYFEDYSSAKELVLNNPEIETISYYDISLESSIGYVNIFGGIGKDFIIYPSQGYEINTKRHISLNLR